MNSRYYHDRHIIFRINAKEAVGGTGVSQLGRACQALNITLIHANLPQAKRGIERANSTLEDRLIKSMRLKAISTREAANQFLGHYIEHDNQQ